MVVEFIDNTPPDDGFMNITVIEAEQFQDRQRVRQKTVVYRTNQLSPPTEYRHQLLKPQIPMEFWEMLHDFSMFLIVDDKHDLGRFSYYDRKGHFYRYKESPHHPSPFHHWQVGILGLFASQLGAIVTKALDIRNEFLNNSPPQLPEHFKIKKEKPIIDLLPSYPELPPDRRKKPLFNKLLDEVNSI